MELLEGCTPHPAREAALYLERGWWQGLTFGDILDRAADLYPDREAAVDGDVRLTYQALRDRANRLALGLMELGVKPLDRALVQLPNWHEFLCAYFALQKVGAVPVQVISRYRQHEIDHLAKLTEARVWIAPERHGRTDYRPIIEDISSSNPGLEHIVIVRGEGKGRLHDLEALIAKAEPNEANLRRLADRRPDPLQVGHLAPTGGTTGFPKLVPHTHNNYLCRARYAAKAWELHGEDSCLIVAPVGHDLIFVCGVCATIVSFGKLVMLDSTEAERICEVIEKERVTAVVWVPTLASRLIQFERLGDYDLGSLKKMYCSGGRSPPDLIRKVRETLGCTVFNGYGGTEGMITLTRPDDDLETVCTTVGRSTCPHDTYKLVDVLGRTVPPGTSGELAVKGPGIFTGYYKAAEENRTALDAEGFFRTGDLARFDPSGNIVLVGRVKEMINRGGESISAVEIEHLIGLHPDVKAVAVVPMPDPEMGEKVCAYVQPRPGAEVTFDGIVAFLRSQGASVLHLPERVEFIDEMPLTKAEKVDKWALRGDVARKRALEGELEPPTMNPEVTNP